MATLPSHDWLTSRPIAHRGLHDAAAGRFENTLSAARKAIDRRYAIECDVQRSRDGEAMVFHDATLDRLTDRTGDVVKLTAAELAMVAVGGSPDMIESLPSLLATIDRATPLICEIKSEFDGDMRLADRVAAIARTYDGPIAIKSFDPDILVHLRETLKDGPHVIPLGIVAEAQFDDPEWHGLSSTRKRELSALTHIGESRPDFLSFWVEDLPHAVGTLFRRVLGRPVVTWTVRTAEQRQTAARWADQMVFEGFEP